MNVPAFSTTLATARKAAAKRDNVLYLDHEVEKLQREFDATFPFVVALDVPPTLTNVELPSEPPISSIVPTIITTERKVYVVGFCIELDSERILLVRKTKPSWQAGLLNGIGGKVEHGEQPGDAMYREFVEEAGFVPDGPWTYFATMNGQTEVHCFWAETHRLAKDSGLNDAGEKLETIHLREIGQRRDVVKNLKWLLPLAFESGRNLFVKAEVI